MAAYELAFEYLLGALEAAGTKGTAVNPPTFYLNLAGVITPRQSLYRPAESRGTLAEYYRSSVVRNWAEFEGEGPADTLTLPFWLEQCVKGGGTIATPAGGTNSRTHTYAPTMNADNLLSSTLYWGDPNIQAFQAAYCMPDEITISGDASGEDGVRMTIKGMGRFPAKTAPSSLPSMLNAPLLAPSMMQMWVDSASAIGTTELTGRVVSAEVTIPSGVQRKWLAGGPSGGLNFSTHGRAKRHATAKIVLEVPDMTQYDLWAAHTSLKTRIQFNGPIIEAALRHHIQFDIYGPFDALDWGELEGTNRTVSLNIESEYDATAGFDWSVVVQNDRATI
jgi:hypothetical protein